MDMKRFFLYAIVIAALALAGCGGNGGTTAQNGDDGMQPTPAEMDLAAVRTALNLAADADRATILAAIMGLQGNQEMEDAVIAQLRTALGLAADATPAMILTAVMDLVGPDVDPNPAATEAATTKLAAIRAEQEQTENAGLGGSDDDATDNTVTTTYSLTLERDTETKVTVADTDLAGEDDPKFTKRADLPDGNGNGYPGQMLVRKMEADDDGNVEWEVVVVRTNIEAPKATPFADVHMLDTSTDTTNDAPNQTNEAIAVDETDTDTVALVMSPSFVQGASDQTELTFSFDDTSTANIDEADEVMGTYDGAMGTYRCNGTADCTVTLDDEGMITAMSDGWIFTPNAMVTVDVADANYLAYGFWLSRTANSDGVVTKYNEVETFAMSQGYAEATLPSDGANVMGDATYSGGAAGVYVRNVTDDDGSLFSATSGHFQADVSLTARFGGGNVAPNQSYSISGTVDNFALSGGEENDWAVALGLADFSGRADGGTLSMDRQSFTTGTGGNYSNTFSGTATGDSTAAAGNWSGTFLGSSTATGTPPTTNPQPTAVIGEFNANFTDGGVAGAYGVTKD